MNWSEDRGATSYIVFPVDDPFVELPRFAKRLRNLRERLLRESWLFEDLGFAGIADGVNVHVCVSHPDMGLEQVQRRLRKLWPEMILADVPIAPMFDLSRQLLALLGSKRGGCNRLVRGAAASWLLMYSTSESGR